MIAGCSPTPPLIIIDEELEWRVPRGGFATSISRSRVVATRWCAGEERTPELEAETIPDCHVVKIVREADIHGPRSSVKPGKNPTDWPEGQRSDK